MSALVASEFRRFTSRRMARITPTLFAGLFVLGGAVAFAQAESKSDRDAAREAYDRAVERCIDDAMAGVFLTDGFGAPAPGGVPTTTAVAGPTSTPTTIDPALLPTEAQARRYCESYAELPALPVSEPPKLVELWPVETAPPTTEVVEFGSPAGAPVSDGDAVLVEDPRAGDAFEGEDGDVGLLMVPAVLLFLGGVVVGASAVGADWRHGVWTTTLTWENRRVRLLLTRLAVVASAVFAGALVLQAVFTLATLPVFLVKGETVGADATWFAGLVVAAVRIAAVVGLGSVIGGSLAMLGRNTAVPIGGFALYAVAIEPALAAWRPRIGSHLLMQNTVIVMGDDPELFSTSTDHWVRTPGEALVIVALFVVVAVVAAAVVFWRRDVAAVS